MTVDEALAELLGDRRTGDVRGDLIMGMNEAMRRRDRNTELGGVVIAALRDEGLSYRDIEKIQLACHVLPHSGGQCRRSGLVHHRRLVPNRRIHRAVNVVGRRLPQPGRMR